MSTSKNKKLVQEIFTELAKGNLDPFVDAMGDDMQWTWMSSGNLSHTFQGKESLVNELLASVRETLKLPYQVIQHRFIADGDFVVVEHTGKNITPDGKPYHNKYCWVCRFSGGKLREL